MAVDVAVEALSRRVEQLERTARRWRRVALAGVFGAAVVTAVAGSHREEVASQTVEAGRFVVRDAEGRVRIVLGTRPDGRTIIEQRSPDGRPLIALGTTDDRRATGLAVFDQGAVPRTFLGLWADGRSGVAVRDLRGTPRLTLVAGAPADAAELTLHNGGGAPMLQLGAGVDSAGIMARDADARLGLSLGVTGDGSVNLLYFGQDQRLRSALGVNSNGTPVLLMWDAAGMKLFDATHPDLIPRPVPRAR